MKRILWIGCLSATCLAPLSCKKEAAAGPPPAMVTQVVAAEAKRQPVTETLSLVGTLIANEIVEIRSETEGTVEAINFQEGQRVEQGTLLIKLDDSKLAASAAEAEANYKLTKSNLDRNKKLSEGDLIAPQELDQTASLFQVSQATLELRKRQLRDARIYAPFAGTVGGRNVSPGQVINKDTTLTWLVDLDPLKAEINVPERFLGRTKVGQIMELTVAAYPGESFAGEIYFIAPQVDPVNRTVLARAYVKNPDAKLKPGMFVNLELALTIRENAVVVPESSLILSGDRTTVLIVDAEQTAQVRPVTIGTRMAGEVEIVSGLKGGEMVIVEGIQKARPGGKVKLAPPDAATPAPNNAKPVEPRKG